MSALTKLFVVLLVLCSLLLSAATVVFVNRTENYRDMYEAKNKAAMVLADSRDTWRAEALAAKTREAATAQARNDAELARRKDAAGYEQKLADGAKREADLTRDRQTALAAAENAQNALKLNEDRLKMVETSRDELLKTKSQLETAITKWIGDNAKLTKENEILARDVRTRDEQIAQLKQVNQQLSDVIDKAKIKPAEVASVPLDLDLKGVVQKADTENGQRFAQISLGLSEKVEKGMQFVVLSPTLEFLGKLTVDRVDQNQSYGHLEGPRVNEIVENCQVRTKLQ